MANKILGIDLGTTNSAMAVLEGGEPTIIVNAEGDRTTPSVVSFQPDGERLVGKAAKNRAVTNPQNTVFSVKRFMGRKFDEVQSEIKTVPYTVKPGKDGRVVIDIDGTDYTPEQISAMILAKMKADAEKYLGETITEAVITVPAYFNDAQRQATTDYTPEQISAMILAKMKADAEKYLGETITEAVITVPAYFNDAQRQATKDAGKIAGLEVKRIVNEPTAAALAYGLEKADGDQKILVFDLGGGTFDVSLLELADGVTEVLATNGDNHLGGDDWDQRIIDWAADQFQKEEGVALRSDPMALQRRKEAAENAKKELSSAQQATINLPFITSVDNPPKHLSYTLTRADYTPEQISAMILAKMKADAEKYLGETITEAVITVPAYFNDAQRQATMDAGKIAGLEVKHIVYELTAAEFERLTRDLLDRCKEPVTKALKDAGLNISDIDEVILVGGSTRMPAVQELVQKITGKKPNMSVNPDEVVADGAAVQGGVLTGDVDGILLLDVTPLSLGVETMGGVMTKMIDRNTTIPTSKTEIYSTAADNQTSVEINVLQGEREFAADNKSLGRFQLTGIPAARRGTPKIEVTFDNDANGIVKVSAKDLGTGKEQQITISGSTALSDEEVDRMVKDAEANAEEDKQRKADIEVRNQVDSLAYSTEETVKDLGDKVPADMKSEADAAVEEAKKALEGQDIDAIKAAGDKLQEVGHKLAEVVYSSAQDGAAQDAGSSDDDVVDADYEVVDDEDEK